MSSSFFSTIQNGVKNNFYGIANPTVSIGVPLAYRTVSKGLEFSGSCVGGLITNHSTCAIGAAAVGLLGTAYTINLFRKEIAQYVKDLPQKVKDTTFKTIGLSKCLCGGVGFMEGGVKGAVIAVGTSFAMDLARYIGNNEVEPASELAKQRGLKETAEIELDGLKQAFEELKKKHYDMEVLKEVAVKTAAVKTRALELQNEMLEQKDASYAEFKRRSEQQISQLVGLLRQPGIERQ